MRIVIASLAIVVVAARAPIPVEGSTPQSLPGGASQVLEAHGDWRVSCAQQNGQKTCSLAQQLNDKDSRQLVIGIELKTTTATRADGTLVMPFGLAVDKPVTLQIDETTPVTSLHFKTCLPIGCVVALSFDSAMVAALRKGTVLAVKATASETGQDAVFKLSLNGFGGALDRTAVLSK